MSGKDANPRSLSAADQRLWAAYTRHVIPLHDEQEQFHALSEADVFEAQMQAEAVTPAIIKAPPKPLVPAPKTPMKKSVKIDSHAHVDGATARKLKRGKKPIEAVIDLHGMTREQAYDALLAKVRGCIRQQVRILLVITGKGTRTGGAGVLRETLPRWLEDGPLADAVLAAQTATAQHGGSGAFYLLLKQQKKGR